jgi:hypothetical protein
MDRNQSSATYESWDESWSSQQAHLQKLLDRRMNSVGLSGQASMAPPQGVSLLSPPTLSNGAPLLSPPAFTSLRDGFGQIDQHAKQNMDSTVEPSDFWKRRGKRKEAQTTEGQAIGPIRYSRLVGPKGSTESRGGLAWDPT